MKMMVSEEGQEWMLVKLVRGGEEIHGLHNDLRSIEYHLPTAVI